MPFDLDSYSHYIENPSAWSEGFDQTISNEMAAAREEILRLRAELATNNKPISDKDRFICKQRNRLDRINEKAVQLRDEIGTGSAVAELRSRVHNLIELTRNVEQN